MLNMGGSITYCVPDRQRDPHEPALLRASRPGFSMPVTQPLGVLLAAGSTADVYALGTSQVLKLYHHGSRPDAAQREADNARAARDAGVPTPSVIDVVVRDGRAGLVFERVVLECVGADPLAVEAQAIQLARLQAELHARSGAGLPPQRQQLEAGIARVTGLDASARAAITASLERLPHGSSLCHGDFHPGNVILTAGGPSIIDWFGATCGHPALDAARTGLLLQYAAVRLGPGAAVASLRARFHAIYLRHYCALSGIAEADIAACILPVATARLAYTRSAGELDALAQLIGGLLGELQA